MNILLIRVQIKSHMIDSQIQKVTKMKEFHVIEPLYIFFARRCLNSVNLWNWEGLKRKKIVRGYGKHFTLFNQCWFIRMAVIVARCLRKWSEDFMTPSNEFYAFHRFADLQSIAFFWKITIGQYFKSLANKSNSHECTFLHFFHYDPKGVRVLKTQT